MAKHRDIPLADLGPDALLPLARVCAELLGGVSVRTVRRMREDRRCFPVIGLPPDAERPRLFARKGAVERWIREQRVVS